MLGMIDMNMGNLQSVKRAFEVVGAAVAIVDRPEELKNFQAIILPGVGAFGDAMSNLNQREFSGAIRDYAIKQKRPLLGICVGMQILATKGTEHGMTLGLDLVPGTVDRIDSSSPGLRVPNMGWCDVKPARVSELFPTATIEDSFYFAHSYHFICDNSADVVANLEYGTTITAAVIRNNIFGVQFHPEKSQDAGLHVLSRFVRHVEALSR
jgi:glutamine amidotransferase